MKSSLTLFLSSVFLWAILLSSCSESKKIANFNFAYQYSLDNAYPTIATRLFQPKGQPFELYFKIPANTLIFKAKEKDEIPEARLLIRYKTFKNYDSQKFADSSVVFFNYPLENQYDAIEGKIILKETSTNKGVLDFHFIDLHQGTVYKTAIPFNTLKPEYPHHHYLLKTLNNDIIYDNTITVLRPFIVEYSDPTLKKLYVNLVSDSLEDLPPPPFQELIPDFKLPKTTDSLIIKNMDTILPKNSGLILIRAERWQQEGIAILINEAPYPEIGFTPQLVAPVRYLTSSKEFKELTEAKETKIALDAFWLKAGGNPKKARELLRVYYSRVQSANKLFASCKQGWQSDRGMIYIIFGPPDHVYRGRDEETWIFKDNSYFAPLSFSFLRNKHPFCENEFTLYRNQSYRNIWYANIESWRKGRIDTSKN